MEYDDEDHAPAEPALGDELVVKDINFKECPHMRQLEWERQTICTVNVMDEPARILSDNAPVKKYHKVPHDERSVIHWGQRKLLLSEIEFLTLYGEPGRWVVYAGAAPGTHCNYLANMFPELNFLLVDPAKFTATTKEPSESDSQEIEIIQTFFTEETVKHIHDTPKYKGGKNTLFVSDIRTADPKVLSETQVEAAVKQDMDLQMDWVINLNPAASMLKFRLPWAKGSTDYLEGDIYLPIWGRETTTECRLISTTYGKIPYDNTKYEEQMFHFNRIQRVQYYLHSINLKTIPGLCNCYDCASEIYVLEQYLLKKDSSLSRGTLELAQRVVDLSLKINGQCSSNPERPRTLAFHESNRQRHGWFTKRTFDYNTRTMTDVGRSPGENAAHGPPPRRNGPPPPRSAPPPRRRSFGHDRPYQYRDGRPRRRSDYDRDRDYRRSDRYSDRHRDGTGQRRYSSDTYRDRKRPREDDTEDKRVEKKAKTTQEKQGGDPVAPPGELPQPATANAEASENSTA